MTVSVTLSKYVLAGLEFLRSLPVSSIVDPTSPGSSFAIHPGKGLIRINGRFIQLPLPSSKTTYQPPTTILEFANPSSRAVPTPTTVTTFDPAALASQSGTGILVALNLLLILWLFSLLALSLTYKPILLTVCTWFTTLRQRVLETTFIVTQSIMGVVLSAKTQLNILVNLNNVQCVLYTLRNPWNIAQALAHSHLKPAVKLAFRSLRVLLPVGALVAIVDMVQAIQFFCDITIPYADTLLVIAASPAAVVSCILLAFLTGIIKPATSTRMPTVEHEADFLAGMRVQRKHFISRLIPRDHSPGAVRDIRGSYHQILRTRDQARTSRSCVQCTKNLVVWFTITFLVFGLAYFSFSSVHTEIHELSRLTLSSQSVEDSRAETSYPPVNAVDYLLNTTPTNAPATLIWTLPELCMLPMTIAESSHSLRDLDFAQFNLDLGGLNGDFISSFNPLLSNFGSSLAEYSVRNDTH